MKGSDIEKMAEILGGMPVWGSLPGSPAHKAGVGYGDILVSVNGQRVTCFREYVEAKKLCDETMKGVVIRDGESVEIELNLRDPEWSPVAEDVYEEIAREGYMAKRINGDDHQDDDRPR